MNTVEMIQMLNADFKEKEDQIEAMSELLNEVSNMMDIVISGRGATGEKINRTQYLSDFRKHFHSRWEDIEQ